MFEANVKSRDGTVDKSSTAFRTAPAYGTHHRLGTALGRVMGTEGALGPAHPFDEGGYSSFFVAVFPGGHSQVPLSGLHTSSPRPHEGL